MEAFKFVSDIQQLKKKESQHVLHKNDVAQSIHDLDEMGKSINMRGRDGNPMKSGISSARS